MTNSPMVLMDIALKWRATEREADEQKRSEGLKRAISRLVGALTPEHWQALGIDASPLKVQLSSDTVWLEGALAVDDGIVPYLVMYDRPREELRIRAPHDKKLDIYLRHSAVHHTADTEPQIVDTNALRVGEFLLSLSDSIAKCRVSEAEALHDLFRFAQPETKIDEQHRYVGQLMHLGTKWIDEQQAFLATERRELLAHLARRKEEKAELERYEAERKAHRLEAETLLRHFAQQHQAALDAYDAECKAWATEQTGRFFHPFRLYKLTYALVPIAPLVAPIDGEDISAEMFIETACTLDADANNGNDRTGWFHVINPDGSRSRVWLAAVVKKEFIDIGDQDIDDHLAYCESIQAGRYVLNISPARFEYLPSVYKSIVPKPPVLTVPVWADVVKAHGLEQYGAHSPHTHWLNAPKE